MAGISLVEGLTSCVSPGKVIYSGISVRIVPQRMPDDELEVVELSTASSSRLSYVCSGWLLTPDSWGGVGFL